jgi:hypothetical protein
MAQLFSILSYIAGAVSLVCLVMVLFAMFQNELRGIAIVCAVLIFVFGIGYVITFIFGWIKSSEWGITKIMLAWTGAILISIVCYALGLAFGVRLPTGSAG